MGSGHHHHHHGHGHHGHNHGGGGHDHAAEAGKLTLAYRIGIALNLIVVGTELVFGLISGSNALVADAWHNLSDVIGLIAAWAATALSKRRPTERFTYGLGKTSILAALFNALFLLVATSVVIWEAISRLIKPIPVDSPIIIAVALIGMVINGLTAWMFFGAGRHDINVRGAFLHLAGDAGISGAVALSGVVILYTGQVWVDPAASLVVSAVLIAGTWGLLRDSVAMSMEAVPRAISPGDVSTYLAELPGVSTLHDLHIWPLSTSTVALSGHLIMPEGHPGDGFLANVAEELQKRFGIGHVTLQIETGSGDDCVLANPETV